MNNKINQTGARANGDIVGGNKIEQNYFSSSEVGVVEALIQKLNDEIKDNEEVNEVIEELQRYYLRRDKIGLDSKLKAAGRGDEYMDALEKKEMFAKVLEYWSLYASAQKIFVFLLARAEYRFQNL
jgi:hypothetical protein